MTNKHTALPWNTDELDHEEPYQPIEIIGGTGFRICKLWVDDSPEHEYNQKQRANARLIVTAVNNHHRLRETLKQALDLAEYMSLHEGYSGSPREYTDARAILAELDKLENGS